VITVYLTGFRLDSLKLRLGQFERSIPFILNNPFGRGFRSFEQLTQRSHTPHHYLLAAGVHYGMLALLIVSLMSVLIFIRVFRTALKVRDPFARASLAAIVGLFVVINFNPTYYSHQLWLSVGIFFAYTSLTLSETSDATREGS
jgi:hypothetical protein